MWLYTSLFLNLRMGATLYSANHLAFPSLSSGCYVSAGEKRVVNVVVEEEEKRSITASKLRMKTQAGEQGAITGMLFLFDAEDPTADGFLDRFNQYDSWTAEDFRTAMKERCVHVYAC